MVVDVAEQNSVEGTGNCSPTRELSVVEFFRTNYRRTNTSSRVPKSDVRYPPGHVVAVERLFGLEDPFWTPMLPWVSGISNALVPPSGQSPKWRMRLKLMLQLKLREMEGGSCSG